MSPAERGALEDRVAIVTGAGRGIGKAIAEILARSGASVVLAARTVSELESVRENLLREGRRSHVVATDLCRNAEITRLVDLTVAQFGRIDILVNNAGTGVFNSVVETSLEEFDEMCNVNLKGLFLLTKAVLPHMMRAESGHIVNVASLAGKNPVKGGAVYAATKWAVRGFSSSLMLEVREKNIRVTTIFPGSVDTTFSSTNLRRENITQPSDVAEAVLGAVSAPTRSMISEIDIRPTRPH
jgi:NADP-dependent 3-hydroxy acid dehydrogenase YdfG